METARKSNEDVGKLKWTYIEGVEMGDRLMRILNIHEKKMNKENGKKIEE